MEFWLNQVRSAMQVYFASDQRRIDHALAVAGHAEELLKYIDADVQITMTAAYLHDIGIHEAERKHGSSSGCFQELEGPAVARDLLDQLQADIELSAAVCNMVGLHHTPAGIDSPEFRILWDADALVNLEEIVGGKGPEEIARLLEKMLVTEAGFRRAQQIYL